MVKQVPVKDGDQQPKKWKKNIKGSFGKLFGKTDIPAKVAGKPGSTVKCKNVEYVSGATTWKARGRAQAGDKDRDAMNAPPQTLAYVFSETGGVTKTTTKAGPALKQPRGVYPDLDPLSTIPPARVTFNIRYGGSPLPFDRKSADRKMQQPPPAPVSAGTPAIMSAGSYASTSNGTSAVMSAQSACGTSASTSGTSPGIDQSMIQMVPTRACDCPPPNVFTDKRRETFRNHVFINDYEEPRSRMPTSAPDLRQVGVSTDHMATPRDVNTHLANQEMPSSHVTNTQETNQGMSSSHVTNTQETNQGMSMPHVTSQHGPEMTSSQSHELIVPQKEPLYYLDGPDVSRMAVSGGQGYTMETGASYSQSTTLQQPDRAGNGSAHQPGAGYPHQPGGQGYSTQPPPYVSPPHHQSYNSLLPVEVPDAAGEGNMEISIQANGRNIQNHVRQVKKGEFEVSYTPMEAVQHNANVTFNNNHVSGE